MGDTKSAATSTTTTATTKTTQTTATTTRYLNPKYYCIGDPDCHENAKCIDNNCVCNRGYFGTGKKCCSQFSYKIKCECFNIF